MELKAINQTLRVSAKIQVSDLWLTLGTLNWSNKLADKYGKSGYGETGYYTNYDREVHLTSVFNSFPPTTEVIIFGFEKREDITPELMNNINITYQPAYGGNTKYPIKCYLDVDYFIVNGAGINNFEKNKFGITLVDFGGENYVLGGCPNGQKKYNGIYTFKTTYKGKTYTSILHLKLNK
ncbi:hypothetical protein CSUB8523_0665 [Campylobacter subantarcticus LMG 24377]|uniref:hypothetical protein n=1 Tax=Campylobacter subantarcticus TaxID=497724 RepID=UPI0005821D37|nr:hypothetical protein [Campylobacter subantarcticus]AJC92190.1 hypothetical protein CSUB8523_0665 [Campylobacter subantarcticus LMG 24377]